MAGKAAKKKGLGRGLSALISQPVVAVTSKGKSEGGSTDTTDGSAALSLNVAQATFEPVQSSSAEKIQFISIEKIIPNPTQPRRTFIQAELEELRDSILNMGVLQPVIVRPASNQPKGVYEIVAGERRWRASRLAELKEIPVIIKELSDWESLEIALVENVQRSDLNPVDEAKAYQSLMDQFSLSQQDVADRIGKDRATVANYLRLLKLPESVLKTVEEHKLSMGHAKAILGVKEPRAQMSLARKAVDEGLSVRALEALASQAKILDGQKLAALKGKDVGISGAKPGLSAFPQVVEQLRKTLGTKVLIKHHQSGRGRIEIEYFSEAELDRLLEIICDR